MASTNRVVALIDMDCFYCAVERALDPSLLGVPLAVVQYNPNVGHGRPGEGGVPSIPAEPAAARIVYSHDGKLRMNTASNGSIIAISYEAREKGVTRFFKAKEAMEACPGLVIIQVPTAHGKSDMGIYRTYGAKTLQIVTEICGPGTLVEKASVDEMYVDITKPAKALLTEAQGSSESLATIAAPTHVAGAAEGEEEAQMGAQPTGILARNSFRAGHAGQVMRDVGASSAEWWARCPEDWSMEDQLLAAGAAIVARARAEVTKRLSFTCSAGVAPNKLLAKLVAGLHKPNQQTVMPPEAIHALLDPLPVDRLRGFGGKLGELLRTGKPELGLDGFDSVGACRKAGPSAVSKVLLAGEWSHAEETAAEVCAMADGIDHAPVAERPLSRQVGSGKNFARKPLQTAEVLEGWVRELAGDISDRLVEESNRNGRCATTLVAAGSFTDEESGGRSKRSHLTGSTVEAITKLGMGLLLQLAAGKPPARLGFKTVYLTAEGFENISGKNGDLRLMFAEGAEVGAKPPGRKVSPGKKPPVEGVAEASRPRDPWSCGVCTLENEPGESRCCVCGALKGGTLPMTQQQREPPARAVNLRQMFQGGHHAESSSKPPRPNKRSKGSPERTSVAPEMGTTQATWECLTCTLVNEAGATLCIVCGAWRGGKVAPAGDGKRKATPPKPKGQRGIGGFIQRG